MGMSKRSFKTAFAAGIIAVLAMSAFSGAALANMGLGDVFGYRLEGVAKPATITSVEAVVSDPDAANFEEEFTYYVIRFEEIEYETWTYREPIRRMGSGDFVSEVGGTASAFWFGVSAPDENGIQHEIQHRGPVSMFYETADGDVYSIRAVFTYSGTLLSVNGVSPSE